MLIGYADATWGGWEKHLDSTMKSTSGYIITVCGGPISWGSILQKGKPAQSSAESEYIAAYHGLTEQMNLTNVLRMTGIPDNQEPIIMYSDSEACIGMSKNPINHKRNKQIMTKYHWVRIATEEEEVKLIYVSTDDQLADILTKVVKTVKQFKYLRDKLMTTAT